MAIVVTHLASGTSGTAGPAYTTASITPAANALILVWVQSRSSGGPVAPTLAGNGLTWVEVATLPFATNQRLSLYRALGAAPTPGAITITHTGGGTMFGCGWSIVQCAGTATTGVSGADAILQPTTNFANTSVNTLTVTLPAAVVAGNVGLAGFALNFYATTGYTPGSGWTLLAHVGNTATIQVATQENATGDLTADHTTTGNGTRAGIAVEIAAAPVVPPVVPGVVWPATLPQAPLIVSYDETAPTMVRRSSVDAGAPKVGRRFTANVALIACAYALTREQVAILDAFYFGAAGGGGVAFNWPHPRLLGVVRARFREAPKYTNAGHPDTAWTASIALEILPPGMPAV